MPGLVVLPVTGLPEVGDDVDLAALLLAAIRADETDLLDLVDGDVLVVSSKIVSKSLGLWADGQDRTAVIAAQTVRTVAERRSGDRLTSVVEAVAGPVMAAAGVDGSNTGDRDGLLLLPADPDAEAFRLRKALLAATRLRRLGVVLSDTAGRPWRSGQTDFALGASGVQVLDDLRGGFDADGRPLAVTARAVADELAAAADLVKGKADGIPAAVVRGTPYATRAPGPGARSLVRTGVGDWFGLGEAEAVRSALGVPPGSRAARTSGSLLSHQNRSPTGSSVLSPWPCASARPPGSTPGAPSFASRPRRPTSWASWLRGCRSPSGARVSASTSRPRRLA